jgi:hypothetical protein
MPMRSSLEKMRMTKKHQRVSDLFLYKLKVIKAVKKLIQIRSLSHNPVSKSSTVHLRNIGYERVTL